MLWLLFSLESYSGVRAREAPWRRPLEWRQTAHDDTWVRSGLGLGTKNRQKQTADICKLHLREKYRDQRELVEEFIVEIEGAPKNCDVTRWGRFTDIKDIKKEMLKRLEAHFEKWINPVSSMN